MISGVPQGTVLGPLLFLIFINDLPECVSSNTRLFADDAVVYRKIHSNNDCEKLQEDLIELAAWELKWGMSFHPDKCNVLRVVKSRTPICYQYNLKGHQLEAAESTKYLGVDLCYNLSWNNHIDRVTKKADSMLGFLKRNLRICNSDTKTAAYFALVRPSLEYCSAVWNPHTKLAVHKLEMVQRRAARYVMSNYTKTSSVTEMINQLNWESLESRRTKIQLTMFYKIMNDLVDIPSSEFITPASTKTRSHHSRKVLQYHTRSDALKYSFFPRTICNWNLLPATVAETPDLVRFKRGLSKLSF